MTSNSAGSSISDMSPFLACRSSLVFRGDSDPVKRSVQEACLPVRLAQGPEAGDHVVKIDGKPLDGMRLLKNFLPFFISKLDPPMKKKVPQSVYSFLVAASASEWISSAAYRLIHSLALAATPNPAASLRVTLSSPPRLRAASPVPPSGPPPPARSPAG
jgi:hypothetical protein